MNSRIKESLQTTLQPRKSIGKIWCIAVAVSLEFVDWVGSARMRSTVTRGVVMVVDCVSSMFIGQLSPPTPYLEISPLKDGFEGILLMGELFRIECNKRWGVEMMER